MRPQPPKNSTCAAGGLGVKNEISGLDCFSCPVSVIEKNVGLEHQLFKHLKYQYIHLGVDGEAKVLYIVDSTTRQWELMRLAQKMNISKSAIRILCCQTPNGPFSLGNLGRLVSLTNSNFVVVDHMLSYLNMEAKNWEQRFANWDYKFLSHLAYENQCCIVLLCDANHGGRQKIHMLT